MGHDTDEKAVHRLLYAAHGRFRCDESSPSRWWPAHVDLPTDGLGRRRLCAAKAITGPDPASSRLYAWQAEALGAWVLRGRRGVVEAVTGTGKTMVGVAAIVEQLQRRGQALVLVPTKELLGQWAAVLRASLPRGTLVGQLGDGGAGSLTTHDVVVAIVNTLRSSDARPIRPHGLLVADECHRYGSAFNRLALDSRFDRRLGLSATYAREDDGHLAWLDPYFGGSCYQLGYRRAIADGVAARFAVGLVGVPFEPAERVRYDDLSAVMRRASALLVERYGLPREPYTAFMREVNALAASSRADERVTLARRYRLAAADRRRLLAEASGKATALEALAPTIRSADRTLIFTQSIAISEAAADRLTGLGIRAGVVHSGLPIRAATRRPAGFRFRPGSGGERTESPRRRYRRPDRRPRRDRRRGRSRRQMIQRMGRILRHKQDGRLARLSVLFVEETVEDPARGAHEGFLDGVTEVADAVRRFSSLTPSDEVNEFLSCRSPAGPPVPVRYAS